MEHDFDTASLIRLRNDTFAFRAVMDMLDQCPTEEVLPEKNHCIFSVDYDELSSDCWDLDIFSHG